MGFRGFQGTEAIAESTTKPGQELVIGDFLKFGDYDGGFTKISMALAVSANSAHPKEAAMLVNYLLNDDEAIESAALSAAFHAPQRA